MPDLSYLTKKAPRALILFAGFLVFIFLSFPADAKIYKWTDDQGKVHFTDNPSKIPKKYREKEDGVETLRGAPPRTEDESAVSRGQFTPSVIEVPLIKRGNSFLVEVELNGKIKARLVLDTGATDVVLSGKMARLLGIRTGGKMPKITAGTAGGDVTSFLLILDKVKAGRATVKNVEAMILPDYTGGDGLLGMTFLGNFKMEVDSANSKMILRRPSNRGEVTWDGRNADWWITTLEKYAQQCLYWKGFTKFFKKDMPAVSREGEYLFLHYKKLYYKMEASGKRVGLPKEYYPAEAEKIK